MSNTESFIAEYHFAGDRILRIYEDHFEVRSGEWRLFDFYVASRVNLSDQMDTDETVRLLTVKGENDFQAIWQSEGGLWEKKEYVLQVVDGAFLFHTKVYGHGKPWNIEFFRGPEAAHGSRFSVAGYLVMNSQNLDHERSKYMLDVEGKAMPYLEVPGTLLPLRAAPPAFVFPFWNEWNDDWIGIGVAAKSGQHNFERFIIHSGREGRIKKDISFELPLMGYTQIDGVWESPYIWGGFGKDDMAVISEYSRWQYDNLGYQRNITKEKAPDWWKGPMFCGWGVQCALSVQNGLPANSYATEKDYRDFIAKLEKEGLAPTVIMIDDKWQEEYGTLVPDKKKWPDLRRFVEEQHENDRRVVLWFKLWDTEGIPEDECVMLDGKKRSVDPTNPKYIKRLQKAVHKLLSDDKGCYNCDGFKLDFMDCFPREAGAVAYEKGVYGLEMMKRLFTIVYRAAKEAKADALINMSSVHPYFSEICDQFRVHDLDGTLCSPISITGFRTEFAQAVMPEVLVDTDGIGGKTREETLRCFLAAPEIGVPDLYTLPEEFDDSDWAQVRKAWENYRKSNAE